MRRTPVLIIATGLATAGLSACGSGDKEGAEAVEEAVHYSGDDRTSFLTDCAKDEGVLELYTAQNPVQVDALSAAFTAKYPFLKVNATRRTTPATAEAVTKEAQARVNKVDVVSIKIEVVETMLDIFTDFDSPELDAYGDDAIGTDGKYVSVGQVPYGVIYNTDFVSAADAPQTSEDLLDPKWKGRIALSTTGPGTQWVGWMKSLYGEEWIERFGEQDIHTTEANTNAISGQVASGEAWIAPAINLSGFTGLKDAPLEWVPIDPTMAEDTVAIAKAAPHPCAAMLYVDFSLSKEGQMLSTEYISPRDDVEATGVLAGLEPAGIWEILGEQDSDAYSEAIKEWGELIDRYLIN
ncbi:ABC transporter substrate-binding protein [Nocardioides humi]|uniref:ABC-type Fe3+ transport system, substrate-binding protein n=1 Tax=Nocardioides humi TaxID=449461 RepID=A0ABN2AA66_9ACTN|nr:extracellular solute-binding protein [Nocardioides humi]